MLPSPPYKLTLQTRIAMTSASIMNTFQAFSGGSVTVADGVRIDVRVTLARLAESDRPVYAVRISVITVATQIAFYTYPPIEPISVWEESFQTGAQKSSQNLTSVSGRTL